MKHPANIEKYNGTLSELAKDISNMRYDKVAELFQMIHDNIYIDAENDADKKRHQLADNLNQSLLGLQEAHDSIMRAWKICKPYMKNIE